ncbi:hypothetical protein BDD12DRAFT_901276 [Trichophaea hybrida]|nr:hypothetical protein BDD12DRAFT_901276 [Trichophaea hybrida]
MGRRKMLVIAGLMKRENPCCNKLLEVVDMTTLKTVKEFTDEEYEVPSMVTEVIEREKPKGGFSSGVKAIFRCDIFTRVSPKSQIRAQALWVMVVSRKHSGFRSMLSSVELWVVLSLCVTATVIWCLRWRQNRMQAAAGSANAPPAKVKPKGASKSIPTATARTQDSKAELEGPSGSNQTTEI